MLEDFKTAYGKHSSEVIADAGYGSEQNYEFMEDNYIHAYVKYNYFHKEQKRGWKKDALPKIVLILLGYLIDPYTFSQEKNSASENRLFHIERSKNRNMVCYDVNLVNGLLDSKQPLKVYWVNQEDRPGEVNGLTAIEKKFAYGYKITSRGEEMCRVTLSAYPERKLTIRKNGDKYICTILINEEETLLKKLYVKSKENNSLSVEYVEFTGVSSNGNFVCVKNYKPNANFYEKCNKSKLTIKNSVKMKQILQ